MPKPSEAKVGQRYTSPSQGAGLEPQFSWVRLQVEDVMRACLEGPAAGMQIGCSILVHGPPANGKLDLARYLSAKLGIHLVVVLSPPPPLLFISSDQQKRSICSLCCLMEWVQR